MFERILPVLLVPCVLCTIVVTKPDGTVAMPPTLADLVVEDHDDIVLSGVHMAGHLAITEKFNVSISGNAEIQQCMQLGLWVQNTSFDMGAKRVFSTPMPPGGCEQNVRGNMFVGGLYIPLFAYSELKWFKDTRAFTGTFYDGTSLHLAFIEGFDGLSTDNPAFEMLNPNSVFICYPCYRETIVIANSSMISVTGITVVHPTRTINVDTSSDVTMDSLTSYGGIELTESSETVIQHCNISMTAYELVTHQDRFSPLSEEAVPNTYAPASILLQWSHGTLFNNTLYGGHAGVRFYSSLGPKERTRRHVTIEKCTFADMFLGVVMSDVYADVLIADSRFLHVAQPMMTSENGVFRFKLVFVRNVVESATAHYYSASFPNMTANPLIFGACALSLPRDSKVLHNLIVANSCALGGCLFQSGQSFYNNVFFTSFVPIVCGHNTFQLRANLSFDGNLYHSDSILLPTYPFFHFANVDAYSLNALRNSETFMTVGWETNGWSLSPGFSAVAPFLVGDPVKAATIFFPGSTVELPWMPAALDTAVAERGVLIADTDFLGFVDARHEICGSAPSIGPNTLRPEGCGDGIVLAGEECDDGNENPDDGCRCCMIQSGWVCPSGGGSCSLCGNGIHNAGEECDDGAQVPGDGCSSNCTVEDGWACSAGTCYMLCGNSMLDAGEGCDDGGQVSGDGCSSNCTVEDGWACPACFCYYMCGDGVLDAGEECDDGAEVSGDGCSFDCMVEAGWSCVPGAVCTETCGNGVLDTAEGCDDGARNSGDGCSSNCTVEEGWGCLSGNCTVLCGNGVLDAGEGCDDAARVSGDGCSSVCTVEEGWSCSAGSCSLLCGNGVLDAGEGCDDGGQVSGDGCSSVCTVEEGWSCSAGSCSLLCGNGVLDAGEGCDDGGKIPGDGCSSTCTVEEGWSCSAGSCSLLCGNGVLDAGEGCDDGARLSGDGCSPECAVEEGWACHFGFSCSLLCGNGVLDAGEECDDAARVSGDGCSSSCMMEPGAACPMPGAPCSVCGNGVLEPPGEQCDDDNDANGDGCSSACAVEPGFVCAQEGGSCVPLGCEDSDCAGECGGVAYYDACNVCVAGSTGVPANLAKDSCGICFGANRTLDGCGVCNSLPSPLDACGVCFGNNETCRGCDGVPFSGMVYDLCGVCGGDNTSCVGCDGVLMAGAPPTYVDSCGVCGGNSTECVFGCDGSLATYDCAGLCGGTAVLDDCDTCLLSNNTTWAKDDCGVCFGNGSTCGLSSYLQCNNSVECFSCSSSALSTEYLKDACGTCGGEVQDYLQCAFDCNGTPQGGAMFDCSGTCGGTAYLDDCGMCCSGTTFRPPNIHKGHCGECFAGSKGVDDCGQCSNNTGKDACGTCFGGNGSVDACGQCWGNNRSRDLCGTCGGSDECLGCDQVPNSGRVFDSCGVCGGSEMCVMVGESTPASQKIAIVMSTATLAVGAILSGLLYVLFAQRRRKHERSYMYEKAAAEFALAPAKDQAVLVFSHVIPSGRWETDEKQAEEIEERHREIARQELEKFDGYEVKTNGAAMFAAFHCTNDALEYCCAARQALNFAGGDVALGVHYGMDGADSETVAVFDMRTERIDYYGKPVNRAARITSAANPAQILVPSYFVNKVDSEAFVLSSIGEFPLKGVGDVELFSVAPQSEWDETFKKLNDSFVPGNDEHDFGSENDEEESENENENEKEKKHGEHSHSYIEDDTSTAGETPGIPMRGFEELMFLPRRTLLESLEPPANNHVIRFEDLPYNFKTARYVLPELPRRPASNKTDSRKVDSTTPRKDVALD